MKKLILAFITINIAIFCFVFRNPKIKKDKEYFDCVVVCGYPASKNGEPSPIMKTRVDKAVALWKEGRAKYMILSGAAVGNEYVEAEVMKNYALEQGVSENAIIEEREARSTYHNMMFVKDIMKIEDLQSCIVVTNGWHLRKANHYARKFGLDYVMAKAENPENEKCYETLWKYLSVNIHMYYMMFRGYY